MLTPVQQAKRALRKEVGARLGALTPEARELASRQARELLGRQRVWQAARSVLFYAPMPGELDVWPLLAEALEAGKTVVLPRYDALTKRYTVCRVVDLSREVAPGHWGIREPMANCEPWATNRLDFILVPGVGFDPHGRRLGRGKGYYDQILQDMRAVRCGVAFDEQIVPEVPCEPHDATLNCILTPTRWLEL